mmetsp:Transcript_16005/g.30733  ORF Transcript_16005/g.30733 Transcript_16005/m.30733 type:complete len:348 (-) Transcript_16005:459-1502(-)
MVSGLSGFFLHLQRHHRNLRFLVHKRGVQRVHRLVLPPIALAHQHLLLGPYSRHHRVHVVRHLAGEGRCKHHNAVVRSNRLYHILGVRGGEVHLVHLHPSLGNARLQCLGQLLRKAVAGGVEDDARGGRLGHGVVAPALILLHELRRQAVQQGAVAGAYRLHVQVLALAHRSHYRPRVGLHEAVVVKSVVPQDLVCFRVKHLIRAVVHAVGVAGEHALGLCVECEDGVRPVQVGSHDERQLVAVAQVQLIVVLYKHLLERLMNQVGEELQANFGAHDGGVRAKIQHSTHEATVVRLSMRHDDVVDGTRVNLSTKCVHVQLAELLMGSVYESHLLTTNDVRIVRGALL